MVGCNYVSLYTYHVLVSILKTGAKLSALHALNHISSDLPNCRKCFLHHVTCAVCEAMSDRSDVFKGVNSIWFRLFNHRGFLNGEIQLLLRELEQKRDEREVEELFAIVENITNIKDTQVERAKQLIDLLIPQARVDLGQSLQTCARIEDSQERYKSSETLIANKKRIDLVWMNFIEDIGVKCAAIDREWERKEVELRQYFNELENNLEIAN